MFAGFADAVGEPGAFLFVIRLEDVVVSVLSGPDRDEIAADVCGKVHRPFGVVDGAPAYGGVGSGEGSLFPFRLCKVVDGEGDGLEAGFFEHFADRVEFRDQVRGENEVDSGQVRDGCGALKEFADRVRFSVSGAVAVGAGTDVSEKDGIFSCHGKISL